MINIGQIDLLITDTGFDVAELVEELRPSDDVMLFEVGEQVIELVELAPSQPEIEEVTSFAFSGGGTIPSTTNLLKGDGVGNAADSTISPASVVLKSLATPTPNTIDDIVAILQAAGLCA